MLKTWKCSYLRVRERIESTRDYFIARWEFDKCKLFCETDYIATVMLEMKNIFRVSTIVVSIGVYNVVHTTICELVYLPIT